MIIRKKFRFEAAHIVRNCTSKLCRENIHGHSYIAEVFIKGQQLDNGCMLMDFCKLNVIKELINSFDHSYCLWKEEDTDFSSAMHKYNKRIVTMPISPSAEGFSLMFFVMINKLLSEIALENGEGKVMLSSVRVHETETGYAEAFAEDLSMANFNYEDVFFSEDIVEGWKLLK